MSHHRVPWSGIVAVLFAMSGVAQTAAPTLEKRSVTIAGVERTYHLHVPRTSLEGRPAPLVLAFHGRGVYGTGPVFAERSGFNVWADKKGFLVVYPDGVERKWLDGGLRKDPRYVKDIEFVEAMIDDVGRRHPVDPKRVYAAGFSNGAAFSYELGVRLAHRIAAVACVGANMSRDTMKEMTAKQEPVSLIQFCGSNDAFCGRPVLAFDYLISYGENRDAWIQHDGCDREGKKISLPVPEASTALPPATVWSHCQNGTEVALVWLEGAVHGWPIPLGRDAGSGTFNPASVIWEFFERHPKR